MVRYKLNKKQTTKDLLKLSIQWLVKNKYIESECYKSAGIAWYKSNKKKIASINIIVNIVNNKNYIELIYTHNKTEDIRYKVFIETTTPNYGGIRYWFICPKCHKRVTFLYGGKYFLCRTCQNLCYETQQLNTTDRMMEKSDKYRNKALNKKGTKKKGMHWKTFYSLMDKADYYEGIGMAMFAKLI